MAPLHLGERAHEKRSQRLLRALLSFMTLERRDGIAAKYRLLDRPDQDHLDQHHPFRRQRGGDCTGGPVAATGAAEKAILFGSGAAVVLRIALTVVAAKLLELSYLQIIGGMLLLWIGVQLLGDEEDGESEGKEYGSLMGPCAPS